IGRPHEEWSMEAARFDEMRRGCWDIDARIADMDLAGIWASLNFPSLIAGFAGTVFWKSDDLELGLATLRAWNDWHLEVWAASYPERIIPLQLPWLADPQLAPEEIRRNAARGFKAVSFPELPAQCGLPSLHSGAWIRCSPPVKRRTPSCAYTPAPRSGRQSPHRTLLLKPSPRCSRSTAC
ncbi:MAG TPA: hypothetical protein VGF65_01605, partial [Mycobacterium sp.]